MKNKRGLTPIIATVLLILVVVVVGIIIFVALSNIGGEAYEKFSGTANENVDAVCRKLSFTSSYSSGSLSVSNNGNIPIVDFLIKLKKPGNSDSFKLSELNFQGVAASESFDSDISTRVSGYDEIDVIPILLAKGIKSQTNTRYTCADSDGRRITL